MNLDGALTSVSQLDGFVAAVLMTYDGLLVEQAGSRYAADAMAAELAGLAEAARQCFSNLSLGDVRQLSVGLTAHDVTLVSMPGHFLAVVFERGSGSVFLAPSLEYALQPVKGALGGRQ